MIKQVLIIMVLGLFGLTCLSAEEPQVKSFVIWENPQARGKDELKQLEWKEQLEQQISENYQELDTSVDFKQEQNKEKEGYQSTDTTDTKEPSDSQDDNNSNASSS